MDIRSTNVGNQIAGTNAQTGDITTGDTAGRDITHGAAPDLLVKLIERQIDKESQFRMLLLDAMEVQQAQVMAELRRINLIIIASAIAFLVLIIVLV